MKIFRYFAVAVAAFVAAVLGGYLGVGLGVQQDGPIVAPVLLSSDNQGIAACTEMPDFVSAADVSVNAVVHVMVSQTRQVQPQTMGQFFQYFFGPNKHKQGEEVLTGSGSGVILDTEGYVVTNCHVVEGASRIDVVLNDRRSYVARLVGMDPTTDIALLQIVADDLTPLRLGDSDALRVGEWVLAVGNPFNLTSTVTAGIISAKSRRVGVISSAENIGIEAFIQTDAAVNPGNSGGALVNSRGELVGINTAIASNTGSYAGYSFAVPSNIVRKVVEDLKEFGHVQRALLGVSIADVTPEIQRELGLERPVGVVVMGINKGSAAEVSGVEVGDVIQSNDGKAKNTVPELQEKVGRCRQGEEIELGLVRSCEILQIKVVLRNLRGQSDVKD